MLRLAGERTAGTVLWMADERAIAEHVVPKITKAAESAGRPAPRVVAGRARCASARRTRSRARSNAPTTRSATPSTRRTTSGCSSRASPTTWVTCRRSGTEADIERRLRSYLDAGTTDFSARILPLGNNRDEIVASSRRTREFLASLAPEIT